MYLKNYMTSSLCALWSEKRNLVCALRVPWVVFRHITIRAGIPSSAQLYTQESKLSTSREGDGCAEVNKCGEVSEKKPHKTELLKNRHAVQVHVCFRRNVEISVGFYCRMAIAESCKLNATKAMIELTSTRKCETGCFHSVVVFNHLNMLGPTCSYRQCVLATICCQQQKTLSKYTLSPIRVLFTLIIAFAIGNSAVMSTTLTRRTLRPGYLDH